MSAPDFFNNPADLTNVLNMLSQPDTAAVKQGEKFLKPFLKNSLCLYPLLLQIQQSPVVAIRHHAALLLKKRALASYAKMNASQQAEMKTQFLAALTTEPDKMVRIAIAGAVALLTKAVMNNKETWAELFALLTQLAQNTNEALRSVTYSLLAQVLRRKL